MEKNNIQIEFMHFLKKLSSIRWILVESDENHFLFVIMSKYILEKIFQNSLKIQTESHHHLALNSKSIMRKTDMINKIKVNVDTGWRTVSIFLVFIAFDKVVSLCLVRKAFEESCKVEGSKFVLAVLAKSLKAIKAQNNKDSF